MAARHEFVRDPDSPAMGRSAFAVKLMRVNPDKPSGLKELVKFHRAKNRGYYVALEPGMISEMPSIRALRLWDAPAPPGTIWSLEEAKEYAEKAEPRRETSILLYTATEVGGLVVWFLWHFP